MFESHLPEQNALDASLNFPYNNSGLNLETNKVMGVSLPNNAGFSQPKIEIYNLTVSDYNNLLHNIVVSDRLLPLPTSDRVYPAVNLTQSSSSIFGRQPYTIETNDIPSRTSLTGNTQNRPLVYPLKSYEDSLLMQRNQSFSSDVGLNSHVISGILQQDIHLTLQQLVQSPAFGQMMQSIFGANLNTEKLNSIISQWSVGDFSNLPKIEVRDKSVFPSNTLGAFAEATDKIYLSQELLDNGNTVKISDTILEEIGHWLDKQLNVADTPGDEGQMFAEVVRGQQLNADRIAEIRAEDDSTIINVDGQFLRVEQSTLVLPTITISANDTNAGETLAGQPTNPGQFTLTRTASTTSALTVNYTVGGTATKGIDYSTLTNSVTFAAGASTAIININPIDDLVIENNETVVVNLASSQNYNLGTASTATVTIADNDKPTITISANDTSAGETLAGQPTNPGQFTLTRTASTTSALTVNYTVGGTATKGIDYSTLTNSVTFAAGASTAIININPIDDLVIENNETVVVNLASSQNYNLGTASTATVTIADNDKPTITISANDTSAGETLAGQPTNPGQFTLTRTGNSAASLTVNYTVTGTATNGTDYNILNNSAIFAAGSSTAKININPIDDSVFEGNQTAVLTLVNNTNYLIAANNAIVVIADNDKPNITVTNPNGGNSLQVGSSYNITWSDNIAENVKIDLFKGSIFNRTLFSSTSSDGNEVWTVPSNLSAGSDYQIKISSLNNSNLFDFGDVNFKVTPAPFITLTSPNGGESFQAGSSYNITWNDNISENVNIDLYKAGSLYSTLFNSTASDGSETWTLPANLVSSSDYRIKISSISNGNIYDWGNNYFTVVPAPYISVTSPNGGNSFQAGSSYNITWNDNISENVKIDLYKAGNFYSTLFSSTTSDGGETWTTPSNLASSSDYKIKIASVNNGNLFDFGDANFTINSVPSDYAGNSLTQARNIGTLSSKQYFSDFIGDADTNDYYKFSVSSPSNFNLSLSGLSSNADVQLIQDINGNSQIDTNEILGSSILTGSSAESISAPLFAGNYYVRIYPSGNSINTNYNLSLSTIYLGNYDYTDPSPNNNSYYNQAVTRSFFNSNGISVYQSQYGTFIMYGSIADYYTNNQYANNNTTNGLFGIYSGLGLPTSAIYKKDDGSFVMEFEGGTLTNRNGIVTPSYNQKASSFALVGQGAPDGTELQWKNDYIYWGKNNVGNPTGSVRHVTGGWVQEFTGSPTGNGDSIFFVKDGQQLTQGGPYRVQGWMLDIYRLTGGYERQNGGLGFATQTTEQSNVNGYKHYHTFENGFIGITPENQIAIKNWQGQLINVVGYDGVAIYSTYRNTFNRDGGSSFLGSPIKNVHSWEDGYIQDFSGGYDGKGGIMKSNANDNSYWVGGDFWNKFLQTGGAGGSLRYPTSDRYAADGGWRQQFQGGTIFKSSDGNFSVLIVGNDGGATHSTYVNTFNRDGGTASLGSPINNVHPWENGYIQDFTGGSDGRGGIMKSNANDNSYWVGGDFWNKFLETGAAGGILGYATSDRYSTNGGWRQDFQGGAIIQSSKGIFTAFGGIGAHYLDDEGGERGRLGSPTSGEIGVGNGVIHQYFDNGYIIYNDNGSTYTLINGQVSGIVRNNFSGWVMPSIGVALRNSPHYDDKNGQAKPYHQSLSFDAWTTGDTVNDYMTGNPDNRWFKVAGTNYWVPSGYIYGNPSSINTGGGSIPTDIVQVNFTGWVMPSIGVALRNSPHYDDKNGQAKPYHETISFDAWTTGDTVTDYQAGTPDNRWFRIAGTNNWVPSGYIYGNPPGSGYSNPGYTPPPNTGSTEIVPSEIILKNFSGWVMPGIGVALRNSPHLSDKNGQAKPYHETISFDAWTTGDTVTDYMAGTPDNRWFRIAGTNNWVPSGYIYGNPEGLPDNSTPVSTPTTSPNPNPIPNPNPNPNPITSPYISISSISDAGDGDSILFTGNKIRIKGIGRNIENIQFYLGNTRLTEERNIEWHDDEFNATFTVKNDFYLGNYRIAIVAASPSDVMDSFYSNSTINLVTNDWNKEYLGQTIGGTYKYGYIERVDSPGYIENKKTWIVIHGWQNNKGDVFDLAKAVEEYDGYQVGDQVLTLDWGEVAKTDITLNASASWIEMVAQACVNQLNFWGISGSNINLVGHSLGAYVSYEISKKMGGINNLVALDPAVTTAGGYANESSVDFSQYTNWSWAFRADVWGSLGSESNARTADESFQVNFEYVDSYNAHGGLKILWTNMLRRGNGYEISQYFGLEDINSNNKPWYIDRAGRNSDWEAEIWANTNWLPYDLKQI